MGIILRIGYARVSTKEQSFDLQIDALRAAGCEKIYMEAVSGAYSERPELSELLRNLRSGDVLIIWKLDRLTEKGEVLVAKSMSVDKERVSLSTLLLAMFYDLSTEKEFVIPTQSERRERALRELIRKRKKPVVLFIDEAHDLQSKTLVGLKRLMEMVRYGGGTLSVVLAGHPKLKNDLRRPTMEEIGNRATVFSLDNVHGANREYIYWLLKQCIKPDTAPNTLFQDEAIDLLAERLVTPLQIGQHVTLALEEAFHIGGQPVTIEVIESVLAKDINEIEPILTRHGYGTKALTELLDINGTEVRKLLRGQLPPARTNELQSQMLKVGLPL